MNARYLATLLLASGLLLGAHAVFCWWVDPYEIYQDARVNPVRPYPIDLFYHLRLTKAYQLETLGPEVVILGSSRAATLPPAAAAQAGQVAYNLALPGATAYEMWSYFRHAAAFHRPDRVIIALDYEAFLEDSPQARTGFSDRRLARSTADTAPLASLLRHYPDYRGTLFSLSAGRSSLAALLGSDSSGKYFYSDGTWLDKYARLAGRPGYRFIIKQYFNQLAAQRPRHDLGYLQKIVDQCYRLNIAATLVISPAHNTLATVYQRTHHLANREQWQRDIAGLLERRARHFGKPAFALWGFEDNAAGSEPIHPSSQPTAWYRDGLHISPAFGRAIVEEISKPGAEPAHGQRLDPRTIDGYLRRTREKLRDYQRANPDVMQWLARLTASPHAPPVR